MWIFVFRRSLVLTYKVGSGSGPTWSGFATLLPPDSLLLRLISSLGFEQSGLFRDQREVPSRTRGWGRGIWAGGGFKRSGMKKIFHLICLLRMDPYAALWTLLDPCGSVLIAFHLCSKSPFKHLQNLFFAVSILIHEKNTTYGTGTGTGTYFFKLLVIVDNFTKTKTNSH